MCLPTTNRSLGEWSKDVADISVEPIPFKLVERGDVCRLQTKSIERKRCGR